MQREALNRELVNSLIQLTVIRPWLIPKMGELQELLGGCPTDEDLGLVIELIKLIDYLSADNYQDCLLNMANEIVARGLDESNTMLVAHTADEEADSGQSVVYDLRTMMTKAHRWRNTKTCNVYGKAQRYIEEFPNVILVDEFIGTGRSLVGRIKELDRHFAQKGVKEYKINPFCIAAMGAGIANVKEQTGHDIYVIKSLKKGISELMPVEDREKAKGLMLGLEKLLAPEIDGYSLPSFGDGEAEALYGRDGGNSPNSVFPIFWWFYDHVGNSRKTLFTRNLGFKE